ncbi:MAG TPA: right-handed parallel beta-helix repeat-containing protein, partial [Planctomycetota bacterium]|nr:right-handed parallel beta-helix repeat-containing protein [Planctomycetota bacterium]
GGAAIVVRGEIHATGSSSEPVLFRSLGCTDRWGAIVLDHTGKSPESPLHTFFRCEIEGAQTSTGRIGSISALEARVRVDSCNFREVNANGVDGLDSRLEVRGCTFERTFEGVHGENTSVSVIGCRFRRMYGNSDAMDLDADGETRSVVQECIFEDVTDDGLDLQATSCDIRDNVFRNVADKAISIEQEGSLGSCIVTGNLIHDSGTGLSVKSGAQLFEAHHDTITGCTEAITLFVKSGTGTTDGGHAEFHSLILWNNASDVRLDSHSSIQFDHSNLQNELVDGEGNISLDPRFTAPALKDYTLQSTSPCIGAGRNGTEMGAFPFDRPDRPFLRSDVNSSGNVNISDAVFLLAYLYLGDRAPGCLKAADADANGGLEVTDAIYLLNFLFLGGDAPPAPFPACGAVPASPLSCSVYAACP